MAMIIEGRAAEWVDTILIYIDIDWVCHSPIGGDGNRGQGQSG